MPDTNFITVAIIDDNRLVREALTAMLNRITDLRVVSSDTAHDERVAVFQAAFDINAGRAMMVAGCNAGLDPGGRAVRAGG